MCPKCFSSNIKIDRMKHIIKCKHCGGKFGYEEHQCTGSNIPIYIITKVIKP